MTSPSPEKRTPLRYEYNEYGGYDCMTGSVDIYKPGEMFGFASIDLHHYDQENCADATPEQIAAATADAAFIVQACNAHDALMEALTELSNARDGDDLLGWVRETARSALLLARGDQP